MPHFLVTSAGAPLPSGFFPVEEFTCPNCGFRSLIARTGPAEAAEQNVVLARGAVTSHCPDHSLPASVEYPVEVGEPASEISGSQ